MLSTETTGGSTNVGLLLLRVLGGVSLFLRPDSRSSPATPQWCSTFPTQSISALMQAWRSRSFRMASVPVALGLATRPAAFVILINLFTAFFIVHHAAFFSNGHVELVWLYIVIFAALIFTGPGRLSVDAHFRR